MDAIETPTVGQDGGVKVHSYDAMTVCAVWVSFETAGWKFDGSPLPSTRNSSITHLCLSSGLISK